VKKWVIGLAILILLSGLVLVSSSNQANERPKRVYLTATEKRWDVSTMYHSGDKVVLTIVVGEDWSLIFADPTAEQEVSFNVTVESESGGQSLYQISYEGPGSGYIPEPGTMFFPMTFKAVEYLAGDCLTGSPEKISDEFIGFGRTKEDEVITIKVLSETLWTTNPPDSLTLYKEIVEREFPYAHLYPWGLGLIFIGAATTFWQIASLKPKRHKVKG